MDLRRVVTALSVCVCVVATGSFVAAGPAAKDAPKPAPKAGTPAPATPPAPAAGSGSGSDAGAGSGSGSGSAVQMTEDAPPADMNGTDENPDAPRGMASDQAVTKPSGPRPMTTGYPIEEALRPITLPQNMSEVSISPHAQVGEGNSVPYAGGDALRARYGITSKIQLGFTYVYAGIYPNPSEIASSGYNYGIHGGKAIGLDVTYQLQKFVGVKVGVPVYLDPVAFSLALGAPMKFQVGDNVAIGGLDDVLNIKLKRFAPDFYQEFNNAAAAYTLMTNTPQSGGHVRIAGYVVYQSKPNVALIGRAGVDVAFAADSGSAAGNNMGVGGGTETFIRAGVQWTPKKFVDLGASLGIDDLGHIGSFGPSGFLAFRI